MSNLNRCILTPYQVATCNDQGFLFKNINWMEGYDNFDFIEKYLKSNTAKELDRDYSSDQIQMSGYHAEMVIDEIGQNNIKKVDEVTIYDYEALFYTGYIMKEMHWVFGISTKDLSDLIDYKIIYKNYDFLHTQGTLYVMECLLNVNSIHEVFDIIESRGIKCERFSIDE